MTCQNCLLPLFALWTWHARKARAVFDVLAGYAMRAKGDEVDEAMRTNN